MHGELPDILFRLKQLGIHQKVPTAYEYNNTTTSV